ncbi:MAG TPA: thiamine pyrophosphate-dependent enzyme, partial [bacterium]|nr:thiamine pyrophosphate-dependent enzyme [bacterium]
RGDGPTLIEYRVERLGSHSSDDQQDRYRPKEEIEASKKRDPLVTFRAYLEGAGLLTDERRKEIEGRIKRELDEATDYADASPPPDPETAARYVYWEPD